MAVTDSVVVPKIKSYTVNGDSSYSTSTGVVLDFTADFSLIRGVLISLETRGSLSGVDWNLGDMNQDRSNTFSPGKTFLILRSAKYDKMTLGNVSGLPSGVTAQTSKFAAGTTTGSSHTHTIDHNHPATESGVPIIVNGQPNATAGGVAITNHTHTVDLANFTGSSAANTHTHDRSFEYNHTHPINQSETDAALTEVTNGTNLSTTVWRVMVIGH